MEVGDVAARANLLMDAGDERVGVALAAGIGMGADAGDFSESGNTSAFAGHGEEARAIEDAEEIAEGGGALAEGAGLSEVGKLDHGGVVGGGEKSEGCAVWKRAVQGPGGVGGAEHLVERAFAVEDEAGGDRDGCVEEEGDHVAGIDKAGKSGDALWAWFTDARERADCWRVAAGPGVSESKRRMGVAERVVDGVIEEVEACGGHTAMIPGHFVRLRLALRSQENCGIPP